MIDLELRGSAIRKKLDEMGQGHVLRWWPELDLEQKRFLITELETLDLEDVKRRAKMIRDGAVGEKCCFHLEAPDYIPFQEPAESARHMEAKRAGDAMISAGKVGVITVAGGQGSRLGYDHPKGMYPIGPVTDRSLFQLHAEKIRALFLRHKTMTSWSVMTSPTTHDETVSFFRYKDYFGIGEENIRFFQQEMIPALDREGRLILAEKHALFRNPNGHGGTLKALYDEGALDWFERRGVTDAFYFQVDNAGIEIADPVFMGFHALAGAEMSNKAMMKRAPGDRLGIYGIIDGRVSVIEYSDFDPELARRRDPDGRLTYRLGSPAVHILNLQFVRRLNSGGRFALPYHLAEKNIPYVNDKGEHVAPRGKNGVKFEMFIFDALPLASKTVIYEMPRDREWAPLKNAAGDESPATLREFLVEKYARWLEAAGARVPRVGGKAAVNIEISPLYALDEAELMKKLDPQKVDVSKDILIGPEGVERGDIRTEEQEDNGNGKRLNRGGRGGTQRI